MFFIFALFLLFGCKKEEKINEVLNKPIKIGMLQVQEGATPQECPYPFSMVLVYLCGDIIPQLSQEKTLNIMISCERQDEMSEFKAFSILTISQPGNPEEIYEGEWRTRCRDCSGWLTKEMLLASAIKMSIFKTISRYEVTRLDDSSLIEMLRKYERLEKDVLLIGLDVIGDRRLKDAVDLLVSLLSHKDIDVVLRTIGALSRIGDERAVKPLGKLALADLPEVPYIALRAIADIGGEESQRTLEMIASFAKNPIVVREALDLIEEMKKGQE